MSAPSFIVQGSGLPERVVALPVRTPLIRNGDDLAAFTARCVAGIAGPQDVICISETAVAIAQGRSIAAEAIRPSALARFLAEHAGPYSTVSQAESMQLVMENAGALRVLTAAAANVAGRLVGRRGDFYRLLGPAVAEIDGYTGTLPPYERHIVFGPLDAPAVAASIALACAAHAAVVDANDLKKAQVLGASEGVDEAAVRAGLLHNPHGNADEQTPLVVLKYRPRRGSPAHSPLLKAC